MFVPDGPGGTLEPIKAICWGRDGKPECPVRLECLLAGEANDEVGVWGGVVRSTKLSKSRNAPVPVQFLQDARLKKA